MSTPSCIWLADGGSLPDTYAAFRGTFVLAQSGTVTIRTLGASWFRVWIDGAHLTEGPVRFEPEHPEYEEQRIELSAGEHVLSTQVHHVGLATRMLPELPPFFWGQIFDEEAEVFPRWQGLPLSGYESQVRRLNPQLGWIEWCDLAALPIDWQVVDYDGAAWLEAQAVPLELAEFKPTGIAHVRSFEHPSEPIALGSLAGSSASEHDEIPATFFLRDLTCKSLRPDGFWRRYDLGRVRLMRPRFVVEAPAGTIVEFAYAEHLVHGRVDPGIPLSAGSSCNLEHYRCREGRQIISPLTPRGGRFVEVHVLGDTDRVKILEENFIERCYHAAPEGAFETDDDLLNRIWEVGVETYRACSEDALVDNPTRERGQWTGDVVTVGMDICSVAYADLAPLRRGLVQSAWCARTDGLISGMCPGGLIFLSSYAELWVNACGHYYRLTGDRDLLEEMYPYALRNIDYFQSQWTPAGLSREIEWNFIDWGYVSNDGPSDMAANLNLRSALGALLEWSRILRREEAIPRLEEFFKEVTDVVSGYFDALLVKGEVGWQEVGIHRAALALDQGLFILTQELECVAFIKQHYLNCFPNNTEAPRLGKPSDEDPQLITPYFSHYVFPKLIERGEMDFVLNQYRVCWGWALEEGRTTWVEVFDPHWSHCHQWSGCPTWQLSRYALGLHPRFDLGEGHFDLNLQPGSLPSARGRIPNPSGKPISIEWTREGDKIAYTLTVSEPITIHVVDRKYEVADRLELDLPAPA